MCVGDGVCVMSDGVCVVGDGVCVVGVVGGAHSESLVAGELELVNTGSGCYE